ncbi:FkbM family methyltransferase [Carboxylicivirga sp. A043]|uniref:FkbM family methyltransferase n=1 Tax=Carboxylicivirga litoralis TaxID=2816963 RepID=UPI0021CB55D8|nr:FkbM family methyltransferase [Carboxylicivirga sp. A043]MCU4156683.1 FkbM family methyltransferase [Carboxylicivirga sp. A043]
MQLKKSIIQLYRFLRGKSPLIRSTIKVNHEWVGSSNGGFFVAPEYIKPGSVVYSFGIGQDISFDRLLIEKYNCQVFGFDPTPKSIDWVKEQGAINNFHFVPVGISDKTGELEFFLPVNDNHVSGSLVDNAVTNSDNTIKVPVKDLKTIAKELGHQSIDVLKMDIEGAEYDVIPSILESGINIRQVLIEFHHRLYPQGNQKTKEAIELLAQHGYRVFATSEILEEISFIKSEV